MLSCTEGSPPHYNRGRSSRSLQSASSGGEVSLEASSPPAEAGGDCRRSLNSLKAQEKSPADRSQLYYVHIMQVKQWKYLCAMLRCMPCLAAPWPLSSELRWWWWRHQSQRAASRQGAALPTPDMPGPALARNIGAEEIWVFSAFYNGPRPPPEILHFYVWINFLPISISIQSCCACVHTSWECVPEPEVGGKSRGLALFWGGVNTNGTFCLK